MRNAVKKRMIKRAVEMVGKVPGAVYPKGSSIMFTTSHKKGEKPASVSCCWYNKTGINSKNTVFNPPEWQNITTEEMEKICAFFDKPLFMPIVYVDPKPPEINSGAGSKGALSSAT
jgi:hypothetical protein